MEKENETKGEKATRRLNVLVAVDGSTISDLAVKRTAKYCQASPFDITLIHVIEHGGREEITKFSPSDDSYLSRYFHAKEEEAKKLVEKVGKTLQDYGIEFKTKIAIGDVAEEIVRAGEDGKFDFIMMGSRGRGGMKRLLLGSVADNVIRHAHCSVAVIR